MIRLFVAVCIGVFAGSLLLSATDLDGGKLPWLLPVTAVAGSLAFTLVAIARSVGGTTALSPTDLEAAARENRISLARVQQTRATGTTINDQPVCEFRLLVASRTHTAYETTTRALVNLGQLPSLQPGAVVVVAQAAADRPEVALLTDPPAEWQQAAAADRTVRAMTSAPVWEAPAKKGRDRQGFWRIPGVVLLLVAVLAFAGRLYPEREAVIAVLTGTSLDQARQDAEVAREEKASIFRAGRTAQVVADMADVAGGTQFAGIWLNRTYAHAEGPTTPGADTIDSYSWRDGKAARDGAAPIQPDPADLGPSLFDSTTVDWAAVADLTGRMAELTGIDDADGPSVAVMRFDGVDGYQDVQVTVWVDDAYRDATVTADAAGQVLAMSGGAPGSPAAQWAAAHAVP